MSTILAWTAISWVLLAGVVVVCHYRAKRNLARQRAARVVIYLAPIPTRGLAGWGQLHTDQTRGLADWDQLHTAIDLARRDFTEGVSW